MTPEGIIKNNICAYLAVRRDCFFWVQESIGVWDQKLKRYRKKRSKYQKNGVPDIILQFKYLDYPPVFVGLEVKDKGKKQTETQVEFEKELKTFGGFYFVVYSAQDAVRALDLVQAHLKALLTR